MPTPPPCRVATLLAVAVAAGLTGCVRAPRPNLTGISMVTVDGDPFSFSEMAGKPFLASYLATWSMPCLAQVPELVALEQKYGPRGFAVVAIGVDPQGALVLRPFRDHYRLHFPVVVADPDAREGKSPFGLLAVLPTSFLVDREGRLVKSIYGAVDPRQLEAEIESTLR